jgi:transcriptional regulator with XRE-family HTH domain
MAMDIGARIRELREERRLTQEDLARRSEVARNTISRFETGARVPSIDMLEKLAPALGVGPSELLTKAPLSPAEERSVLYLRGFLRGVRDKRTAAQFALENPPDFTAPPKHIDAREWLGQWAQFAAQLANDAERIAVDWWRILGLAQDHATPEEEKALLTELRHEVRQLEEVAPKVLASFNEARERYRREAHLEAELSSVAPQGILEEMHA